MQLFDHARDRAAAAGAGKSADKYVVAGRGQFDAHLQRAQRALLADKSFAQFGLRGGFERNARRIAPPAQFRPAAAPVLFQSGLVIGSFMSGGTLAHPSARAARISTLQVAYR